MLIFSGVILWDVHWVDVGVGRTRRVGFMIVHIGPPVTLIRH